ncbi:MAG TPA: single-stranded DNA-binding protein [bacterium]|jgi:single-strand DNA-binding protein
MADLRMPDINSVIIVGNLIKDPTFRSTTTGVPVANFTIASNRKFKDNSGSIKEDVCFIGVVAWYKLAESCYENLRKGSAVLVEGELQSRSWKTEDGFNRSTVEIKARRIQFLNHRDAHHDEAGVYDHEHEAVPEGVDSQDIAPESEPHDQPKTENDFDFGYRGIKL